MKKMSFALLSALALSACSAAGGVADSYGVSIAAHPSAGCQGGRLVERCNLTASSSRK